MGMISTAEAAERLGICDSMVRRLIREGRLKARRVGRAWVIEERHVVAYEKGPGGWPKGRPRKTGPRLKKTWPGEREE